MSRWHLIALISAVVLWWLFQNVRITNTNSRRIISLVSAASKENIYNFLKNPANLIKVHPYKVNVLNIESHQNGATFQFEENLLLWTASFNMTLFYDDVESTLHFHTHSGFANVTVRLQITSDSPPDAPRDRTEPDSKFPTAVTVKQTVTVETCRVFSYLLSSYIASIWESTVRTAISLLNDQTLDVSVDQ